MRRDPTWILGISAFYHDSAACLLCDEEIVAAAQEERFTRKKGDASFPTHAASYCLREGGIEASDLKDKLYMENQIRDALGYGGEILYAEHRESHAASAFFPSPFDEAAIGPSCGSAKSGGCCR